MSTGNEMHSICEHNQIAVGCGQCAEKRAKNQREEEQPENED